MNGARGGYNCLEWPRLDIGYGSNQLLNDLRFCTVYYIDCIIFQFLQIYHMQKC